MLKVVERISKQDDGKEDSNANRVLKESAGYKGFAYIKAREKNNVVWERLRKAPMKVLKYTGKSS